jgi:hypothetical protein
MSSKDSLTPVLEKVHLLIAEMKYLQSAGPHFRVVHRFRMPGTDCAPGEEIVAVFLIYRGREYRLRLSLDAFCSISSRAIHAFHKARGRLNSESVLMISISDMLRTPQAARLREVFRDHT